MGKDSQANSTISRETLEVALLDVTVTRDVSSITQGIPVIVDLCFYDGNGDQCAGHPGIEMTLDCSRPQNTRNDITFQTLRDVFLHISSRIYIQLLEINNSGFKDLIERKQRTKSTTTAKTTTTTTTTTTTCISAEEGYNLHTEV